MSGSLTKWYTVYSYLYGKIPRTGAVPKSLKKIVRKIAAYLRYKHNKAFLKEYRCRSWRDYNKEYDTDIIRRATLTSQWYVGYPYILYFENTDNMPKHYFDWIEWLREMVHWADDNCKDKFRWDIHRVIREKGLIHNEYNDTMLWSDTEDFSLNDIGGHDVLFLAFKNEKDYMWFKLRWL